jgi:hypothetical protein
MPIAKYAYPCSITVSGRRRSLCSGGRRRLVVPRYDAPPAGLPPRGLSREAARGVGISVQARQPLGVSRPMACGKPEDDGYESKARAWWSGGLTWVGHKPAFVGGNSGVARLCTPAGHDA